VIHRVAKGDTISEISARYAIPASEILSFNRLSARATLRIGMELMIPGAKRIDSKNPQNIAKTGNTTKPVKLTPIPTERPTSRPIVVDENGIKSKYTINFTGKGR
jgi:LysM repeat protein